MWITRLEILSKLRSQQQQQKHAKTSSARQNIKSNHYALFENSCVCVLQGEPGEPGRSGQKVKKSPVDAGETFRVTNGFGAAPAGWSHCDQPSANMHLVCCTKQIVNVEFNGTPATLSMCRSSNLPCVFVAGCWTPRNPTGNNCVCQRWRRGIHNANKLSML